MAEKVFKRWADESRKGYGSYVQQDEGLRTDHVQVGALLRIADAAEAMAKRHTELIDECERLKQQLNRWQWRARSSENSNRALRGVITKLKRKTT